MNIIHQILFANMNYQLKSQYLNTGAPQTLSYLA